MQNYPRFLKVILHQEVCSYVLLNRLPLGGRYRTQIIYLNIGKYLGRQLLLRQRR